MYSCGLRLLLVLVLCRKGNAVSSSTDRSYNMENSSEQLGGGAINEKQRTGANDGALKEEKLWDPSNNLSHLLHSIVGLDRYPNYLSRYDESDITAIEHALEQTLNDVRQQKEKVLQRRDGIKELVKKYNSALTNPINIRDNSQASSDDVLQISSLLPPDSWSDLKNILSYDAFRVLHASIISLSKSTQQKVPTLQDVMRGKFKVQLDPALLEDWMNQECFDVYSFQLLNKDFCTRVRHTITDLSKLGESSEFCSLLFGRRPIDFDTVGLSWISDMLLHCFIRPISQHLYATTEKLLPDEDAYISNKTKGILNWRQGYVAGYSASPQGDKAATRHRLVPHSDDSEITLNCCLGEDDFEGGNVQFFGLRGTTDEGTLLGEVERPSVGRAIIHAGRHLHAVTDVTSGNRYALIVWTRSWGMRSLTCPCCYLNRRIDTRCICDKRWN